ncbi:hypothetical protein JCM30760_21440 [Thiomicrorhabdus hydrogeniphila]
MKTIETLVEDTKVGSYLLFIYSLILTIVPAIVLAIQFNAAVERNHVITQEVASFYNIPESSSENLMCFQGILHYKNIGEFSGALAFSPNISCSQKELEKLQENTPENIAYIAFVILLVGLLTMVVSWIVIRQSKKE